MSGKTFRTIQILIAVGFTIYFLAVVGPAVVNDQDIIGGFAAGFVNPYAAGYSGDVFFCYAALLVWVIYEAKVYGIKKGWVCLVLGVVPGVAVGLALYIVLRQSQLDRPQLLKQ